METTQKEIIYSAASSFDISGEVIAIEPFGSGHINDTYKVTMGDPDVGPYLLQRINHHVFKDVEALMQNIDLVVTHLKGKYRQQRFADPEAHVLTIIPHKTHQLYYKDGHGNFWRMFVLLENTKSYDIVATEQQAREGGRAFGRFQQQLSDLDARLIKEVLPYFHHIGKRLDALKQAVSGDAKGRLEHAKAEVEFVLAREARMRTILQMGESGILPLRITHNDTKFNNLLFDARDQAQCVIDLDTVMPGYVAYDFGDAIRTIINSAAEDEADLDKITLNMPLFEAYTAGYVESAAQFLTKEEIDSLIEGVFLLPYIIGVRFLTDYLEGDHYFKTHHPEHNLQRTRAQLQLVAQLEKNETALRNIVYDVAERHNVI